jgi:hypothetical protein
MSKLRYFWAILALVAPLAATEVHAQTFGAPIDLLAPVQEDIIHDLEQNGSSTKPSAVQYRPSYPPKYIKALQECDNEEISRYIAVGRVTEDVDFDHPLLLRRARECGAISSERLEELLYYQRKYYDVDRPDTLNSINNLALDGANLVDPPERNDSKTPSPQGDSSVDPEFIKALQECNNSYISGYIEGKRAGGSSIPSPMLQRAQQCGAI